MTDPGFKKELQHTHIHTQYKIVPPEGMQNEPLLSHYLVSGTYYEFKPCFLVNWNILVDLQGSMGKNKSKLNSPDMTSLLSLLIG